MFINLHFLLIRNGTEWDRGFDAQQLSHYAEEKAATLYVFYEFRNSLHVFLDILYLITLV